MKKIGSRQKLILSSLIEHLGGQERCGWVYDNRGEMIRVLNALVKSGFVMNDSGFYYAVKGVDGNPLTGSQLKLITEAVKNEIS